MLFEVTYMSGAGNIFAVIDNRKYNLEQNLYSSIAKHFCDKRYNRTMQTEGLLVIGDGDDNSDFKCYYFNPDGTYNMMCGNGGRCALLFAYTYKFISKNRNQTIIFNMLGTNYTGRILEEPSGKAFIELNLPPPIEIKKAVSLCIEGNIWNVTYINLNSDHVVVDVSEIEVLEQIDLNLLDISKYGPLIRYNEMLGPDGCNANFYKVNNDVKIYLRTFERGVEKETGACGTGAISTAITAVLKNQLDFPVTIVPTSQSQLIVDLIGKLPDKVEKIILKGEAEFLGSGKINIDE